MARMLILSAVQHTELWIAPERAMSFSLQDGLSRYLLRGCGDGFPKWWLLKAINESQLSTPNNDNACQIWVRLRIGGEKLALAASPWKA